MNDYAGLGSASMAGLLSRPGRLVVATLGFAITGLALAVVLRLTVPRHPADRLARALAHLEARPWHGRLTGLPYVPPAMRTDKILKNNALLRGRREANAVLHNIRNRDDIASRHIAAVAAMVLDDFDGALATLENLSRRVSHDAAVWNDLSVVQLEVWTQTSDPLHLVDALSANRRALLENPNLPEALFNEAMIHEAIGLHARAMDAYAAYLQRDPSSKWSDEARTRLSRLRTPMRAEEWKRDQRMLERAALAGDLRETRRLVSLYPQEARTWSETIFLHDWAVAHEQRDHAEAEAQLRMVETIGSALVETRGEGFVADAVAAVRRIREERFRDRIAHAYLRYHEARRIYQARDSARALPIFQEAARIFAACESPMSDVALYYAAQAIFDAGRTVESEALLRELLASVVPRHAALKAQLLWLRGTIATRRGLLHEALAAQKHALAIFDRLGEVRNRCAMSSAAAGTLSFLGRRREAWQLRVENFAHISRLGEAAELQTALNAAARTEIEGEHWTVALPLLAASLDANLQKNPRISASSLVWYALAEQTLGVDTTAKMLERADAAAKALRDPAHRERAQADVTLVRGIVARRTNAALALRYFNDYIAYTTTHAYPLFLPEAHVGRARALRTLGDERSAESDLREALRLTAARTEDSAEQRSTYSRTADIALRELVDLLIARGDEERAYALADSVRGAAFGTRAKPGRTLSPGALVIEYVALEDRLVIFTQDARGIVDAKVSPVRAEELRRAVEALDAEDLDTLTRLEAWLLAPVAEFVATSNALLIVPDRIVSRVPFAALRLSQGQYLVEQATIEILPAAALASDRIAVTATSLAAIGDPAFDSSLYDLPRLPAAAAEARLIAREYRDAVVLTAADATRENVERALSRASVVHLATHAVVIPNAPSQSYLVLAPANADRGGYPVEAIERRGAGAASLIVLTGCRTAAAEHGAPIASLALAFLAAGATNVVGSLWDVPDGDVSVALAVGFHRALRAGATPAAALREAQLAFLRSTNAEWSRPSSWATYQVYTARSE